LLKLAQSFPDPSRLYLELAENSKDISEQLSYLKTALEHDPESVYLHAKTARIYLSLDEIDLSI
jgi:Tfp pilus assembly protein PilF